MAKEKFLIIFIIVAISIFLFSLITYAWQEPTTNPPDGNVYAPINTGPTEQIKDASIIIRGWDAVFKSVDNQTSPHRYFHLIGTYHGWDAEAIYIAGYNYYNSVEGNVNASYAKRVHFGRPEKMTIDLGTGNVGIGTTAPATRLHVKGDGAGSLAGLADSGVFIDVDTGGQSRIELRGGTTPYIDFVNNPTDSTSPDYDMRLRLTGDDSLVIEGGNVGIGETNPTHKLQIKGDVG
ncbi:MAG: hypothetical protein LR000_00360, partial [Candidatus Pacebacteria bacterium]|nr:hypothetical protein [Candidatus Paceibacterota bacterium]